MDLFRSCVRVVNSGVGFVGRGVYAYLDVSYKIADKLFKWRDDEDSGLGYRMKKTLINFVGLTFFFVTSMIITAPFVYLMTMFKVH